MLVEGPVEVVLPDGSRRVSERPVVALCACRRSRTYPFCDTSHRRHGGPRRGSPAPAGSEQGRAGSERGGPADSERGGGGEQPVAGEG
ncbi:CDGSH iron-sulfur domain-containing protein [Kitasatospora sp. NPDC101157]|uniref:CDGSH iron-sulfur domain-containing protein n=1 Tax=Kitasatospora sp. NPDC101157 TaxID=3364098 RepID=UPI003827D147